MFLSTFLLSACLASPLTDEPAPVAEVQFPSTWVRGEAFRVVVDYRAREEGAVLRAWQLTPAALEADGAPLGERSAEALVPLGAGDHLRLDLDLSKALAGQTQGFQLGLAGGASSPKPVRLLERLPAELDFMQLPVEELEGHLVLMRTTQGEMIFELWPEVAPNHVRNWLDLVHTKFYDGTQFHRVSPVFMIQGGCPMTRTDRRSSWGLGEGPRKLELELNDRLHKKGVLSMARGSALNSGSCQFFVITRDSPQLDGNYTTFGKLLEGYGPLAKIGNAKGKLKSGTITPDRPQRITQAIVVREAAARGTQD